MAEDSSDPSDKGKLNNYKGQFFDDSNEKYTCPGTGAHFEFQDMCQRLKDVIRWRKIYEQKLAAFSRTEKSHEGIKQVKEEIALQVT